MFYTITKNDEVIASIDTNSPTQVLANGYDIMVSEDSPIFIDENGEVTLKKEVEKEE